MPNQSKAKGTRFESAVCNVINDFAGSEVARRVALHGNTDNGDIHIVLGDMKFVGECKYSKSYPAEGKLLDYRSQTVTENENAGGDGGLLFVNLPGRRIQRAEVWLQRSTHYRLELLRVGIRYPEDIPPESLPRINEIIADSEFSWRRLTLFDFLHEYLTRPAWEYRRH